MKKSNQFTALLSKTDKTRSHVKVAFFTVLSLHVGALAFMLMEGCRQEPSVSQEQAGITNNLSPADEATNLSIVEATHTAIVPSNSPPELAATNPPAPPQALPPHVTTEYSIARGDTLNKVAKLFHTTAKAVRGANPGVEPTQLHVGQVIHLPRLAAATTPNAAQTGTSNPVQPAMKENTYTVESGDRLFKIAAQLRTTVNAIRAANGLKTDRIYIGQKLKMPSPLRGTNTSTPVTLKVGAG